MQISERKMLSYIKRAITVSENSPDAETQVGSVLVSKETMSVISEGYNGFCRKCDDDKLPKTRPDKHKFILHAESNLITNCAINGIRTLNCFVVQTHSPCINCMRLLYQAGITEVYFKEEYKTTKDMEQLGDLKLEFTSYDLYTKIQIKPNI